MSFVKMKYGEFDTIAKENCWNIDGKQYSYLLDAKKAVVFARIAKRRRLTYL